MTTPFRSTNGCWTCRLRRKKCDEFQPVCNACTSHYITCHYSDEKPAWMDGGVRQEEMALQTKREVKENAHRVPRRRQIPAISHGLGAGAEVVSDSAILTPSTTFGECGHNSLQSPKRVSGDNTGTQICPQIVTDIRSDRDKGHSFTNERAPSIQFERSDTVQLIFYLEHLLPFLFPFYNPSILQGGRAWILELMICSAVVRQATLCLSAHFFSLVSGVDSNDTNLEKVLTQTQEAFVTLRHALQIISSSSVSEHIHGAVRVMASIMQIQRFEIAVLSFGHCHAHLSAGLTLFKEILDSANSESTGIRANFYAILDKLGPTPGSSTQSIHVPSAEQAAFRFSSALLILDDIIASTVLRTQPMLYNYHCALLGNMPDAQPVVDLGAVIGCQNLVLHQIGEIAVLDAWKYDCKRAGSLDIVELVHRATAIKVLLQGHLAMLEIDPSTTVSEEIDVFNLFASNVNQLRSTESLLAAQVWTHAALLYLFVVVSGWQPAADEVRCNMSRIVQLMTMLPPPLLRTIVWPFCVAGCLAQADRELHFRGMVEALQPPSVFGTVHKALEIMENVWQNRDVGDVANRDLAACFRSVGGDLVLLV